MKLRLRICDCRQWAEHEFGICMSCDGLIHEVVVLPVSGCQTEEEAWGEYEREEMERAYGAPKPGRRKKGHES